MYTYVYVYVCIHIYIYIIYSFIYLIVYLFSSFLLCTHLLRSCCILLKLALLTLRHLTFTLTRSVLQVVCFGIVILLFLFLHLLELLVPRALTKKTPTSYCHDSRKHVRV